MKDYIVEICTASADTEAINRRDTLTEQERAAWDAVVDEHFPGKRYAKSKLVIAQLLKASKDYDWRGLISTEHALRWKVEDTEDFTFRIRDSEVSEDQWDQLFEKSLTTANLESWRADGALKPSDPAKGAESSVLNFEIFKKPTARRWSYESILWLWDESARPPRAARGRALVCRSNGNIWSITFRRIEAFPEISEPSGLYLNDPEDIPNLLFTGIFGSGKMEVHGLVVITGRTGSLKSKIAESLVKSYLKERVRVGAGRRPHLITFEDPIENHFDDISGCDYTPLERGRDIGSLEQAANNALRQTPAVLFVGELRNAGDWQTLLRFAGTGHLVVTTSHAGSLTEAFGNILQGAAVESPADRSTVGDRLRAVVHLKAHKDSKTSVGCLIPALWRQTPEGIKALMAEGLSSLLPNTPWPLSRQPQLPYCLGRFWFLRELLQTDHAKGEVSRQTGGFEDRLKRVALEWDHEGV